MFRYLTIGFFSKFRRLQNLSWLFLTTVFIDKSFLPLQQDRDRKLRIFAGSEHPFGDRPVEDYAMPPRQVREMRPRARRALVRAQKKAEQQEQGTSDTRKKRKREDVEAEASV